MGQIWQNDKKITPSLTVTFIFYFVWFIQQPDTKPSSFESFVFPQSASGSNTSVQFIYFTTFLCILCAGHTKASRVFKFYTTNNNTIMHLSLYVTP